MCVVWTSTRLRTIGRSSYAPKSPDDDCGASGASGASARVKLVLMLALPASPSAPDDPAGSIPVLASPGARALKGRPDERPEPSPASDGWSFYQLGLTSANLSFARQNSRDLVVWLAHWPASSAVSYQNGRLRHLLNCHQPHGLLTIYCQPIPWSPRPPHAIHSAAALTDDWRTCPARYLITLPGLDA